MVWSALTTSSEEPQNPVGDREGIWLEQITYLPIVLEDKGQKRNNNRIGVFHEYAFLSVRVNTFFLSPSQSAAAQRYPSPLPSHLLRAASNEIRPALCSPDPISPLPRSSGTRVVSSHIHAGIRSRTSYSYPPCQHFKLVLTIMLLLLFHLKMLWNSGLKVTVIRPRLVGSDFSARPLLQSYLPTVLRSSHCYC